MKQVNNICMLAVASSAFAAVSSPVLAQGAGFYNERAVTTIGQIQERYAPLGLKLGGFNLYASTGLSAKYLSNAKYSDTNEQSDTILTATPSVELRSGWSRHAFNLGVNAAAKKYSKFDKDNTTDWSMFANGRYDLSGRSRLSANLVAARGTQGRDSNELSSDIPRPVRTNQYSGYVTFETEFNRLRFLGTAGTSKYKYNGVIITPVPVTPSNPTGLSIFNQHDRDMTVYDSSGRLDYAISPDSSVYVYGALNRRNYDNNNTLDSNGHVIAVGARFDFSTLITGEVEAGTMKQTYKSFATKDNNAYYRANVIWSPTPLTSVTGRLGRQDAVSSAIGAYGTVRTEASASVDHELLRNLLISGLVSRSTDEFKGLAREDKRDTLSASANYFLSSRVSVNAELRHEKLESTGAQRFKSYKNNVVHVGLVLNY